MPEFKLNEPISTAEPTIEVTVNPDQPLALGVHVFRLVVVDQANNESAPAEVRVRVVDNERPTAILEAPETVGFRQAFKLNGEDSFDPNGNIREYRWELISAPNPRRDQ